MLRREDQSDGAASVTGLPVGSGPAATVIHTPITDTLYDKPDDLADIGLVDRPMRKRAQHCLTKDRQQDQRHEPGRFILPDPPLLLAKRHKVTHEALERWAVGWRVE